MTLTELRYIVAVAQERNFRRAAQRVFVSQPALSLAVQKLEQELGVQLFERNKNEVAVTETGGQIIAQAQRVLEECARIKKIAHGGANQLAGRLKVGVIFSVAPYLMPDLIPLLKTKAPDMPLEIEENLTANLEVMLDNGWLDVIIIALPFGGPGIATRPLYDEPFAVLVPSDHRWANRRRIKAEELAQENVLLLNSGHCFSNQVMEACPEIARGGGRIMQGNSLETVRNMVASGLGITVLPASASRGKYGSELTCAIPFSRPAPSRRIALAWRKSFVREQAIAALAEAIAQIPIAK
jgi:LysR family hydrogen peroxide-inducible transcriptional activator